ncbi:aldolase catalytic domain-containing protein [Pseudomonas xantholysinigenes]|uniref:Aldolase catalytic domain-containing protein n=1 Tax=Pseudomonas xantholysinigenes TaxID=2745490 RepID=A0A9E6TYT1_9PSED|nr:aldolase catalytic domain-containing protein [Pseudomonas xantholysinigenes]QXI39819.1 aldolase catalytic domain-containing protein [Pseudomonas xantholysinigenes]
MYIIDCTLRDGGYYNNWDFPQEVVNKYLQAMAAAGVDVVELGLRSLKNTSFKGASAFTTDDYIRGLNVPSSLDVGVMLNASELFTPGLTLEQVLAKLFPQSREHSPVSLVRIACHVHEFAAALPAVTWLKARGFQVGFNLMQVADRGAEEIKALARQASEWPLDVLYFADSMGSMNPDDVAEVIGWFRAYWHGPMGIHTHDNMSLALANTLRAKAEGIQWLDATVTGMGRGPGNAKTEYLVLELTEGRRQACNITPLMVLVEQYFKPLQQKCGWGTNTYYYLSGKYGIHPTYIQEMLGDSRYSEEDILAVIEHLRIEGGKKFSLHTLDAARNFYQGPTRGAWSPAQLIAGREVLLIGTGPGVAAHKAALERYIEKARPFVIALNTQTTLESALIDVRVACHPVRLLADCAEHVSLPQPLITPASMLPEDVKKALQGKTLLDFGIEVKADTFEYLEQHCVLPVSMVIAYALAISTSGKASRILLAGFDGYGADDPRNAEMVQLFKLYSASAGARAVLAVTPTRYDVPCVSIYGDLKEPV